MNESAWKVLLVRLSFNAFFAVLYLEGKDLSDQEKAEAGEEGLIFFSLIQEISVLVKPSGRKAGKH